MMDEKCFQQIDGRDFSRILRHGIKEMGARAVLCEVLDGLPDATQARQLAHAPEAHALLKELADYCEACEWPDPSAGNSILADVRAYLAAVEGRDV